MSEGLCHSAAIIMLDTRYSTVPDTRPGVASSNTPKIGRGGREKGGGALRAPHFLEGKGGPGPPRRVRPAPVTVSEMYFNCVFDINSIANSIRKVHSVKKIRLRRATAAQRPSIVRKSLYIDVLGKILDLRGAQGAPVFWPKNGGGRFEGPRFFGPRLQHCSLLSLLCTTLSPSLVSQKSHSYRVSKKRMSFNSLCGEKCEW